MTRYVKVKMYKNFKRKYPNISGELENAYMDMVDAFEQSQFSLNHR